MQIRFNEVLTPATLVAKLTTVLADLELRGLDEMTEVRVELRPGTVNNQKAVGIAELGRAFSNVFAIDVKPGDVQDGDPPWVPIPVTKIGVREPSPGAVSFADVMTRYSEEIDIGGSSDTLSATDDPAALVPRLLRLMIGATTQWEGMIAGVDKDAIAEFDTPREDLSNHSYWDATLDDGGFMRIFTLSMHDITVDEVTLKRLWYFRNFPMVWRLPKPGVPRKLQEKLLADLGGIVGSRLRAASIITLRPVQYSTPRFPPGARHTRSDATLFEVMLEAENSAEVFRNELDGYRREWRKN